MAAQLIKVILITFLFLSGFVVQAANECQVIVTKANNLPYPIIIMSKRQNKNFNIAFKRIQSPANNIMASVKIGAVTVPVFIASGQSYFSMEGSRLVKIQCLTSKTSQSGNLFPTPKQVITRFKSTPQKIVSVLKTLLHKGEGEIAQLMAGANISPSVITLSIKNVFSGSATVAKRVVVGLTQAGLDAKTVAQAAVRAFGSTASGKQVAKWLRSAGYTTIQKGREVAQILKDVFGASRTQGQQWLTYAGYRANEVRDFVQRIWGTARSATRTATRTVTRGATAIWGGVTIYATRGGKIVASDIANQMKKARKSVRDVIAALKKFGVRSNNDLINLLKAAGYTSEQIVSGLKRIKLDAYTVIHAMVSAYGNTATGKNLARWLKNSRYQVEDVAVALNRQFRTSKQSLYKMLIGGGYKLMALAYASKRGLKMRVNEAANELYKAGYKNKTKLVQALRAAGYTSVEIAKAVASIFEVIPDVPGILSDDVLFASYKFYYKLVSQGVRKNRLNKKYLDALLALNVGVSRTEIRVGTSSYLSKNSVKIGMTDCTFIYFPATQNVRAITNGQNISRDDAYWLLHEIRRTIQCNNRMLRKRYALMWWHQLPSGVVKSIKNSDAKYLHDAMPMEDDASTFANTYINQFQKELVKNGIRVN